MLRRRLLLMLAAVTLLMLGTAISSVLLMQSVLRDMEHINSTAMVGTATTSQLGETISSLEFNLIGLQRGDYGVVNSLEASVQALQLQVEGLGSFYDQHTHKGEIYRRLLISLANLEQSVQFAAQSGQDSKLHAEASLLAVSRMRQEILNHSDFISEHMKAEQYDLTARFRRIAITLAIVLVGLINVSIFLLIRAAAMVLRPVDRLIEASRHLAHEDYGFRVEVGRKDEFDELAQGFNRLAEHMQSNEQRKVETLHQVSRTLSHELNNAMAIIELQLRMVAQCSGYDTKTSQQLRLIHEALGRMNETVAALTRVRRVVLTDYIKGVKMIDLKLSTQPSDPEEQTQDIGHGVSSP